MEKRLSKGHTKKKKCPTLLKTSDSKAPNFFGGLKIRTKT